METIKVVQLKEKLRELGLPLSENKSILFARLEKSNKEKESSENDKITTIKQKIPDDNLIKNVEQRINPNRKFLVDIKEIDEGILMYLDDNSLFKTCQVNKYTEDLSNELFWNMRIKQKYGGVDLSEYKGTKKYIEIYKELRATGDLYRYGMDNKYVPIVKYLFKQKKYLNKYLKVLRKTVTISELVKSAERGERGDLEMVKYLVSLDSTMFPKVFALMRAADKGHLEMVKLLWEYVDNNTMNDTWYGTNNVSSIFRRAAEQGHLEILKFLWCQHILLDFINKAFIGAAKNNHQTTVEYLIDKEADIHADNDQALRLTAGRGYVKIVKYLLEKGANINVLYDALKEAGEKGRLVIVKKLIGKVGVKYNKQILKEAYDVSKENIKEYLNKFL